MGFLAGKRILVLGVASKLSIASGIASAMHREGDAVTLEVDPEQLHAFGADAKSLANTG